MNTTRDALLERALKVVTDQRVAFLAVGGFSVVQGVGWFALFHLALGDAVPYLLTLALAYVPAIFLGFFLYRTLVFKVHGHLVRDFVRFTMVQAAAFALNSVVLPFCHEILHLPLILSQCISVAVIVVFNYVGHLYFSFHRKHEPEHVAAPDLGSERPDGARR